MTAEDLLVEARAIYAVGKQSEGEARQAAYEAVVLSLERIVDQFPGSDLSVQILLGESVGGIDIAEVRRAVAAEGSPAETSGDPALAAPLVPLTMVPVQVSSEGIIGSIQPCFPVRASGDLGDASIVLNFIPDDEGRVQGTPMLVEAARSGPAERRLFRLGVAALEECQPYRNLPAGQPVRVLFTAKGAALPHTPSPANAMPAVGEAAPPLAIVDETAALGAEPTASHGSPQFEGPELDESLEPDALGVGPGMNPVESMAGPIAGVSPEVSPIPLVELSGGGTAESPVVPGSAAPTFVPEEGLAFEGVASGVETPSLPAIAAETMPPLIVGSPGASVHEFAFPEFPVLPDSPVRTEIPITTPVTAVTVEPAQDIAQSVGGATQISQHPVSSTDAVTPATVSPPTVPMPTGLAGSVQRCFAVEAAGDTGDAFVQFRVVLDEEGMLAGPPVLTAPGRVGPAERRLLRLGSAALEECQPYTEGGELQWVEVVFGATGVTVAESVARLSLDADLPPMDQPSTAGVAVMPPPPGTASEIPVANIGRAQSSSVPAPIVPSGQDVVSLPPTDPQATVPSPLLGLPTTIQNPRVLEEGLGLDRATRREIQRRLVLLGFDTRGVDGIFGPGTRVAISSWQRSRALPDTSFLDRGQVETLRIQTEAAYERWSREQASAQARRATPADVGARPPPPTGRYLDSRGCLREADGRYVANFKATCR